MEHKKILSYFQVKSSHGNKSQCICPAHNDKQASLTITEGGVSALLYCHAGCRIENILQAVGLKKSDLFYQERRSDSSWKTYVEEREKKKIEAVYHYTMITNNQYAFTKLRLQGKKILYGILEKERFTYGLRGKDRKSVV